MPTVRDLIDCGQSVWLDTLSRTMLDSGELQSWIARGVRGVTANPTILDQALTSGPAYDDDIRRMAVEGNSTQDTYEKLVLTDIGRAADLFLPVFEATGGQDGFVSLEIDPHKAYDTATSIAEVRDLATLLHRPNVMFKVPATSEGIPAIEQLISEGININITLIFSLTQYQAVAEAYIAGLERLRKAGGNIKSVASVASFFLSRIDTMVDEQLQTYGIEDLQGKTAIASAKLAYARFRGIFTSARWLDLATEGARVQRPLWASTSTKNAKYADTMYVDSIIGADTVNTLPIKTLQAFLDHGNPASRIEMDLDDAGMQMSRLDEIGIDLVAITDLLEVEGVEKFSKSHEHLMANLDEKRRRFRGEAGLQAA